MAWNPDVGQRRDERSEKEEKRKIPPTEEIKELEEEYPDMVNKGEEDRTDKK